MGKIKYIIILINVFLFSCKNEKRALEKSNIQLESNLDAKFFIIRDSMFYKKLGYKNFHKLGSYIMKVLITNKSKSQQELIYKAYDKEHNIKFICSNLNNKYYFKKKLILQDMAFDPYCKNKAILKPGEFDVYYIILEFGKCYRPDNPIEIDSVSIKLMGTDTLNQIYCSKSNIIN